MARPARDEADIMQVLLRMEGMQRDLASKLDAVTQRLQHFPAGSTVDAKPIFAPNGAEPISPLTWKSSNSGLGRRDSANSLESTEQEDKEEELATATDVNAMYSALGWRKNMVSVFQAKPGADRLTKFAYGPVWAFLNVGIIVVNTVVIGIEMQVSTRLQLDKALHREGHASAPQGYDARVFSILEFVFLAWMITEVLINGYAQKKDFFLGRDWAWNMFDVFVIILSIGFQLFNDSSVTWLRVARVFRFGKILRAFRVFKFLRGIRSMIISMTGSFLQLVSAILIMCLFMFTIALVLMQGIGDETGPEGLLHGVVDLPATNNRSLNVFRPLEGDDTLVQQVSLMYGSIERTMMTLFMTVSGGLEWREAARPIAQVGWFYGLLWVAYIAFMVFGMLNVLTGIFVDAAIQAMMNDRDNLIQTQLEERNSLINTIRGVFQASDSDHSGFITKKEFSALLKNAELVTYLEAIGIDSTEAQGLFRLLDDDSSGKVSIDEFVSGFLRLKGGAKAVDMVMLLFENRKINKKLNKILREARHAHMDLNAAVRCPRQIMECEL